jgi:hypothetical protein
VVEEAEDMIRLIYNDFNDGQWGIGIATPRWRKAVRVHTEEMLALCGQAESIIKAVKKRTGREPLKMDLRGDLVEIKE